MLGALMCYYNFFRKIATETSYVGMNERTWRESKQRKTNQEINREKKYIWKDTQTLRTNFCSAVGRGMVAIICKLID